MAALDREERAAEVYAGLVRRAGQLAWSSHDAAEPLGGAALGSWLALTPGGTGARSPGGWLSGGLDRSTLVVAGVATLGLIMAVLDTTIVNVALDTLSRELHSPLSSIQWVSTGYLLSLAAVIPLSGWLTERFGSKRTWIASIALFAFGSALCALATSAGELIAFRILQGLGGGMLMPVGFTLIAQSAGPRRVGRALAAVGVPILLGPIFGPIIGGLIVDNASWQWIFVVNVPIAGAAILLAARVLKPDAGRVDAGKLDWLGAALLCPGLTGIVFGLSETETHGGITHLIAFGPILAGLALVGLFIWHSLHVDRPLIDLRLFRSPGFSAAAATTFFLGAALFGTLLILPLYYQVDRGRERVTAGLLLAPQGIGAALMLPISGRLTDRIGGGPVVLAGCLLLTLATVPFMFVTGHTPYALLAGVLFVRGCRARRRGPALRRRGLPAHRLGTGAAGHRRAQHPATNRRVDRRHPARRRPPARGHRRSLVAPLRRGRAADPTPKRRTRPDQRTGRERVRSHVSLGAADCDPDPRLRRRAGPRRAHPPPPTDHHPRGAGRERADGPPGARRLTHQLDRRRITRHPTIP